MKFEQLRIPFLQMEFDEQLAFMDNYIINRTTELQKSLVAFTESKTKKSPVTKKDKQLKVTGAQMELLKQLGLI
jgi:hypothetical protein